MRANFVCVAGFSEKLLLSNGLNVSPLSNGESKRRSLREVMHAIDNEKDLSSYLGGFANKIGRQNLEIRYEKNPVSSFSSRLYIVFLYTNHDLVVESWSWSTTSSRSSIFRLSARSSSSIFPNGATTYSTHTSKSRQSTIQPISSSCTSTT